MKKSNKKEKIRSLKRVYYSLVSLSWLGIALPTSIFILLLQARGLDLFQIGMVMGIYSATIALLEIPTGGLADSWGQKPVAILAGAFASVSSITFFLSFDLLWIIVAWILAGVARALSSGALESWFINSVKREDPEADLQPLLAMEGSCILFFLGVGSIIGGTIPLFLRGAPSSVALQFFWENTPFLFTQLPAEGSAVLTPYSVPLLLSAIVHAFTLTMTIFLVKEEKTEQQKEQDWLEGFRQVPTVIKESTKLIRENPILLYLLIPGLTVGVSIASIENLWQPHFSALMGEREETSFYLGMLMACSFFVGILGALLSTKISKWLKGRHALVAAIFQGSFALVLFLLAWQTLSVLAATAFILSYISSAGVDSPARTLINNEIPSERRSSMLSIQSLIFYIGGGVGSTFLGYIATQYSISHAWTGAAIFLIVGVFCYWKVDQIRKGASCPQENFSPNL